MRLRRKPWIDEAIKEYDSFLHLENVEEYKGKWRMLFANPDAPLWVELGTGKGNFISKMAELHPEVNFIGIEIQIGVIYYAGKNALLLICIMFSSCALMWHGSKIFLHLAKSTDFSLTSVTLGPRAAMRNGV